MGKHRIRPWRPRGPHDHDCPRCRSGFICVNVFCGKKDGPVCQMCFKEISLELPPVEHAGMVSARFVEYDGA